MLLFSWLFFASQSLVKSLPLKFLHILFLLRLIFFCLMYLYVFYCLFWLRSLFSAMHPCKQRSNTSHRHNGDFLSLLSSYLEYLTVRQTCDGQWCQAHGYVQKKNKTGSEVQVILTKASLGTRPDVPPTKERKHSHEHGQSPNEGYDVSDTSCGDDSVVTKSVIDCCKGSRHGEYWKLEREGIGVEWKHIFDVFRDGILWFVW